MRSSPIGETCLVPVGSEILAPFDLADPAFIADPYPVLAELQAAAPIFWYEPSGQWFVTRHALVHGALRDRRMGRSYTHRYTHEELGRPEPDARWTDFFASERWSLLNIEPPDHSRIRSLIAKVFTPTSVAALRPELEQTAAGLLAPLAERGGFDLVREYAQPYSVAVICAVLGVPPEDSRLLLGWSHAIVKMYELTTTDEQRVTANAAAADFIAYVRELIGARRAAPDGLLLSRLIAVEEGTHRLTTDEIISTTIVLLNAGHEATVNTLGNGMRAFMLHPGEWRRVTSGEVPARAAIEEMVRWDSPLQLFERWVLDEGVEIAGQAHVGDEIAMLFGAANRDPDQFESPATFDAGRGDASHVGFGGGIHFCVGAPLARLELEIAVAELARATPELELAAQPRYHEAFVIRGLTGLQLAVASPRRRA